MKGKYLISHIIMVISILLLIGGFVGFSKENEKRVTQQNMEYAADSTQQLARRADEVLREGSNNIVILSTLYSLSLKQPEVDIRLLQDVMKKSVFDYVEYVSKEGINYAINGEKTDVSDRQYYVDGMNGNTGVDIIFDTRLTHETVAYFYAPIYYQEEIIGVLLGAYQSENCLSGLTDMEYFDEAAEIYLCIQNGNIVASNQPQTLLDTRSMLNISNMIEDLVFYEEVMDALETGTDHSFLYGAQKKSIASIARLERSGWYLVQIFPQAVNTKMMREANLAGVRLEIVLIIVELLIMGVIIYIYQTERRKLKKQVQKTESYMNAVLAGSIIVFEANLTQNQVVEGAWADKNRKSIPISEILGIQLPYSYDDYISMWAERFVDKEARARFLEECSRETLLKAYGEGKMETGFDYVANTISDEEIYARRSIYLTSDAVSGDIIAYCNVKDITQQREREEALMRESRIDELTKCYNRRSYEEDIRKITDLTKEDNLVYVSIDVNGLKKVNDTLGHAAGDELILGTARCLKQCLGSYGKIYRTGGDEFIAITYVSEDRIDGMKRDLAETVYQWSGKEVKELSISCGYAAAAEHPDITIKELARIADSKMYDAKDNYYKAMGLIRRGARGLR